MFFIHFKQVSIFNGYTTSIFEITWPEPSIGVRTMNQVSEPGPSAVT